MSRKAQKINIYKIAEEAGVSIATVSRVMNNKTGVSESAREKISALLRKYNFVPNYPTPSSRNIGLVIVQNNNNFSSYMNKILTGVSRYTHEYGINTTLLFHRTDSNMNLLERIRQHQCAAAALILPDLLKEELVELGQSSLPVVLIDSITDINGLGYVKSDSFAGAYEMTDYLIKKGHQKLCCLHYMMNLEAHKERFEGYLKAMREHQLKPCYTSIDHSPDIKNIRDYGYKAALEIIHDYPETTAIIALNDELAMGVLHACFDAGKRVPEDIAVTGFNNTDSEHFIPPLTTVETDVPEIGYQAVKFADILSKRGCGQIEPVKIIKPELLIRQST